MEDSTHVFFPLVESGKITAKPEYTRARKRLAALQAAGKAVKANIPLVERFIEEVEKACDEAIEYMSELKVKKVTELRLLEDTMDDYIRSTMTELYDNVLCSSYRPAPGLATIAWNFPLDASDVAAQIFVGMNTGLARKRLEDGLGVTYEIAIVGFPQRWSEDREEGQIEKREGGMETTLNFVFEDFMVGLECGSLIWSPEQSLSRSISSYGNSAFLPLPDHSILACGGGLDSESQSKAYLITPLGEVQQLQNMKVERSFHSMLTYNAVVYIYGGRLSEAPTKRCEKLSLLPSTSLLKRPWLEIANMCYPREGCNPCIYNQRAYLCGGATEGAETFEFTLEVFDMLPFRIPDMNSPSVTIVISESIFIITHEDIMTVSLSDFSSVSYIKHTEWPSWGNSNPLYLAPKLYIPSLMQAGVIEIDLIHYESRLLSVPGSD